MRVAITQNTHQVTFRWVAVMDIADVDPSITVEAEEGDTCFVFANAWSTGYSNIGQTFMV